MYTGFGAVNNIPPPTNQVEDDLPNTLDPLDMDWMKSDADPEISHDSAILPEGAFGATGAPSDANGFIKNISPANQAFLLSVGGTYRAASSSPSCC